MLKKQVIVFVGVMLIITVLIFWKADFIERHGSAAQVWVMVMLVLLTAAYVSSTKRMAEEMKEQRYDALRPIIDIQRQGGDLLREGLAAQSQEFSYGLSCVLRNIGVGPALDVYSFIIGITDGERRLWPFGTLVIGETTPEERLSLEQTGNWMGLVARYKDIYGRDIESRREVSIGQVREGWKIGPLETEVRKVAKGEHTK